MGLVITAVAMTIASQLLLEAQARLSHSARQALDPAATIALKQIRADVRASSGALALDNLWSWQPLVLLGHPAGTVHYEKVGTDLVRRVKDGEGPEQDSERIVMRGVTVWRWRQSPIAPLPLIEIELGYRELPRLGLRVAAGQREAPVTATRSHLVAASPRMARGKRGW